MSEQYFLVRRLGLKRRCYVMLCYAELKLSLISRFQEIQTGIERYPATRVPGYVTSTRVTGIQTGTG